MKNLKISTKLSIIIFTILLFIVGMSLYFLYELGRVNGDLNKEISPTIEQIKVASNLDSTAQFIRYYDEILTQSSRNYAFTGDKKWLVRYNENIPKLDEMIKDAINEGDEEDKELFISVDDANKSLIQMETESQAKVQSGDKEGAIAILESEGYSQQKDIYSNALKQFAEKRGLRYDDVLQASTDSFNKVISGLKKTMTISEAVGTLLLIVIIILTIIFIRIISKTIITPLNKLEDATTSVAQGDLDVKIDVNSNDEIGELANNFNAMVAAVKESRASVDRKVEEQTEEIKEAKVKDEAYLESIGDGVVAVDKYEKVILVNLQAEIMLGYRRDELINRKFSELIQLVDKNGKLIPINKRPIKDVLSSGKKDTFLNYYYIRKDKTKFPIALTTAPIILNKEIIGAIDVFRDITQEKLVDQAKTEFVSLASHQLRTPLSAVNWYAEMLLAGDVGKLTTNQTKYIEEIYAGNQRMVDLVNALLDVSRIELGTFAIDPEYTDIREIVKSLLKEIKSDIIKKHHQIIEEYDKNLPIMLVDKKLLRIVIQNLLTNAIKYTPEKGKIVIKIFKKDPNLEIVIADNGYGIPKSQQVRIFDKLFRADNIRAKDTEGTGLGLYIVKSIITQAGGKIWFDSVENKGTTFHVSIPLKGMTKKEGTKALEDIK